MIVDGCAGAGGWAEGLRALGRESLGVELDPDAVATSRAAGHRVVQADVSRIDPRILLGDERCEGVIFGPPCPSFSTAGKRQGRKDLPLIHRLIAQLADGVDSRELAAAEVNDPRSLLTVEPMRWVYLLDPDWVALEQVPAVLPVWQDMAEVLGDRGYHTWAGVVYAERYGVPQTRQRAVLLAHKHHRVGEPPAVRRRYYPPGHRYAVSGNGDGHLPRWISMAEALGWDDRSVVNTRGDRKTPGGNDFTADRPSWGLTEKERSWWVYQPWLHEDMPESTRALRTADWPTRRPATTIAGDPRCFPPGGHHVPGAQSRGAIRLSIEEASILQSFRRDYPWQGKRSKQFLQCGNAVPVKLARALLEVVV